MSVKVYLPVAAEGYRWCQPDDFAIFGELALNRGVRTTAWITPRVELVATDGLSMVVGHADLLPGPNFVVSDRAREVLEDVVRDDGEFLPLSCEEEPLWLLSITRVIDALDPERSSLEGNEWSKYVVRHWFREELLRDVSAFCLPREKLVGGAYVTDRFVAAATEHHLVGRDFRLLWEAAATPKRFANQAREGATES